VAHEMAPVWRAAPFGSARDAMSSQDVGDGVVTHPVAQFGEFPSDLEVTPVSILACQSHNVSFNGPVGTEMTALSG